MVSAVNISHIEKFLPCQTPEAWVSHALKNQDILLIDHANCEKKAAANAIHFLHCYPMHHTLLDKLARLAREELLHFQKVCRILKQRNISYLPIKPSRYAQKLRAMVCAFDPERLIDLLIVSALIEARSCERFARIAPHLDSELQVFYNSLLAAEARHFEDYLRLAESFDSKILAQRLPEFMALEKQLIETEDELFRFHSGIPVLQM